MVAVQELQRVNWLFPAQDFYEAAGAGSWQEVVTGSGHSQFCQAGFILDRIFGALCHTGYKSNRVRPYIIDTSSGPPLLVGTFTRTRGQIWPMDAAPN